MATVAPPVEQATDLLQKLSLDPKKKASDATEIAKKHPQPSANGGGDVPSAQILSSERSLTPIIPDYMDPGMWYPLPAYYYGGYESSLNEWEDYSRYVNQDGVEMPSPPGLYGDIYHHGYGYTPYSPYPSSVSPVPTGGHDSQMYGAQHYQYPSSTYYQSSTYNGAPCAPPQASTQEVPTSTSEQPSIPVDISKANSNGVTNGNTKKTSTSVSSKPTLQNSHVATNGSLNNCAAHVVPSGYQDLRYGFDGGVHSPIPWFDGTAFHDGHYRLGTGGSTPSTVSFNGHGNVSSTRNQNVHSFSHLTGVNSQRPTSGIGPITPYLNRMYSNGRIYSQYGNGLRNGFGGYGLSSYDSRMIGRWGMSGDSKYKPRARVIAPYGYGNDNTDGLSELNKGPRAGRFKNQKDLTLTPAISIAVKGQTIPTNDCTADRSLLPDSEQFNLADFPESYPDGRFYVIKSYSEDDIHKSIKYGVWASTPNGSKKLDISYQEAQEKEGKCPIFLFYSVNTSGQFVGVAEMVGPVDFNKKVDYWQQDKWTGCFPVKWHIVKDVPNGILKHIILENNDNKPVTNSRDTQEVKLDQGLQMLKLFKDHIIKTSILDDFGFYEARQKAMQEKRSRQHHKQASDGNSTCIDVKSDAQNSLPSVQGSLEVVSLLKRESSNGKPPMENGLADACVDISRAANPATAKIDSNGNAAHIC